MRLIKNNGKLFYTIKKFKIELQCDATTHPRKMAKRKRKRQKTGSVGEEEQVEALSPTAGGSIND